MISSGAIPKGGARPKTRVHSNKQGNQQNALTIEPLEKKELTISVNGVQITRPALHPDWAEKRIFMHYQIPPQTNFDDGTPIVGAEEAWVEQMEFFINDLTWILNLPHQKFWSQMVYDKSVHECLESFLSSRPRWFEEVGFAESMALVMNKIDQLIFLIYVRMSTYKESKMDHLTPSVFGEIIYNNYLFDSCKLLDLCILYGSSNKPILEKMLNNIFTQQPKYYNDLKLLVSSLIVAFENVEVQLGFGQCVRLGDATNTVPLDTLHDTIMYLMDIFLSLQAFFQVFPKAVSIFHKEEYDIRLAVFYEKAIPSILEHLASIPGDSANYTLVNNLQQKLNIVRTSALAVFKEILHNTCILPIKKKHVSAEVVEECMTIFVHIVTTCVEENAFIADYSSAYDLNEDVTCFKQAGADVTALNFVHEAVNFARAEMNSMWKSVGAVHDLLSSETPSGQDSNRQTDSSGMNGYYDGKVEQISEIDIACLLSNIQDLLPDLGAGFIKKCLAYYNYSSEDVLNAILESNLPPILESLDRTMTDVDHVTNGFSPDLESKMEEHKAIETSPHFEDVAELVYNRANLYNDDEFDVFSKMEVDKEKVHKGKKERKLEKRDESLTRKLKEISREYDRNLGYSIYEDEIKYNPIMVDTYDDEYDDTYDDDDAGNIDRFGGGDRHTIRIPNLRGKGALNKPIIDSGDSSSDEATDNCSNETKDILEFSGSFRRQNTSYQRGLKHPDVICISKFKKPNPETVENTSAEKEPRERFNSNRNSNRFQAKPFIPFCQNPEELRRKAEERRQSKWGGNKGWHGRDQETNDVAEPQQNKAESQNKPKYSAQSTKHSGKSWRNDEDNAIGSTGGKYKVDTNHGKAQDKDHRHKMIHKNEHRRQAAQTKYRNNF